MTYSLKPPTPEAPAAQARPPCPEAAGLDSPPIQTPPRKRLLPTPPPPLPPQASFLYGTRRDRIPLLPHLPGTSFWPLLTSAGRCGKSLSARHNQKNHGPAVPPQRDHRSPNRTVSCYSLLRKLRAARRQLDLAGKSCPSVFSFHGRC
ncbi:protein enabled homolog [Felis catus]|uniref:protein enabled homolog n=1 Tax=Felis catus TaxID=9685 RepID=UPI0009485EB7|nr:protein enabled homolog [Felis catus]